MSLDAFFKDTDDLDFSGESAEDERGALLEVLDRLLERGVVIVGDLRISVADVDLLFVGLKLFVSSIDTIEDAREAMAQKAYSHATANARISARGGLS